MDLLRRFWEEEEGVTTIELVMIIAILMCVALLFKDRLISFVTELMDATLKVPTN